MSSIVGVLNSCFWLVYSLSKFDAVDWKMFIPNAIGIPLMLLQCIIWYIYKKKTENGEYTKVEDEKTREE